MSGAYDLRMAPTPTEPMAAAPAVRLLIALGTAMVVLSAAVWITAASEPTDTMNWLFNRVLIMIAALGVAVGSIGFGVAVGAAPRWPVLARWLVAAAPIVLALVIAALLNANYAPPEVANMPSSGPWDRPVDHPESSTVIITGFATSGLMAISMIAASKWSKRTSE